MSRCAYTTNPVTGPFSGAMPCVLDEHPIGTNHAFGISQGPWWGSLRCSESSTDHPLGSHGACFLRHVPTPKPTPEPVVTHTVCEDCGATSPLPCPYGATTCSECSMMRERSVAGLSDVIPSCAAHGAYLDSED